MSEDLQSLLEKINRDGVEKARAEAEKIDFVFDSSGKTFNQQPALLYYPIHVDLTDKIITELNRRATEKNPQPETTK